MNHKGQKYHFEFEDNKQIEWKDLSKYRIDQKKYIVFFLDLNTKAISYQLIESYLTLSIIGRSWSSLFFNSFLNVFQFEEEIKYQKAEISKESQRKTFDWKSPQRILFGVEIKNEPHFENGKFGKIKQTFTINFGGLAVFIHGPIQCGQGFLRELARRFDAFALT